MSSQQEIPLLIDVQETPNPQVRKFIPGRPVTGAGESIELSSFAEARKISDLAASLFELSETKRVFLGRDFVSVMIETGTSWDRFTPVILSVLSEHFAENKPVLRSGVTVGAADDAMEILPENKEIVDKIKAIIDHRVRPAVAADGGDILFRDYKEGIVYLVLKGACAGCPSAQATLKDGVENLLRHFIPEVKEVRQAA